MWLTHFCLAPSLAYWGVLCHTLRRTRNAVSRSGSRRRMATSMPALGFPAYSSVGASRR